MTAARRLVVAVLVLACSVGLAACGSKSDDGKNAAAAAAVSQSFLNAKNTSFDLTTTQAGCLGTGVIDDFGVAKATSYKFLAAGNKPVTLGTITLSPTDAATFTDTFIKCTNPAASIKSALIAQINPKTSAKQAALKACLDRTLTTALMRKALIAGFSGDTANASLNSVFAACGKLG